MKEQAGALSILDSINLSILDFKFMKILTDKRSGLPINLSILDFKSASTYLKLKSCML